MRPFAEIGKSTEVHLLPVCTVQCPKIINTGLQTCEELLMQAIDIHRVVQVRDHIKMLMKAKENLQRAQQIIGTTGPGIRLLSDQQRLMVASQYNGAKIDARQSYLHEHKKLPEWMLDASRDIATLIAECHLASLRLLPVINGEPKKERRTHAADQSIIGFNTEGGGDYIQFDHSGDSSINAA